MLSVAVDDGQTRLKLLDAAPQSQLQITLKPECCIVRVCNLRFGGSSTVLAAIGSHCHMGFDRRNSAWRNTKLSGYSLVVETVAQERPDCLSILI